MTLRLAGMGGTRREVVLRGATRVEEVKRLALALLGVRVGAAVGLSWNSRLLRDEETLSEAGLGQGGGMVEVCAGEGGGMRLGLTRKIFPIESELDTTGKLKESMGELSDRKKQGEAQSLHAVADEGRLPASEASWEAAGLRQAEAEVEVVAVTAGAGAVDLSYEDFREKEVCWSEFLRFTLL
jgi:hypothetical protein